MDRHACRVTDNRTGREIQIERATPPGHQGPETAGFLLTLNSPSVWFAIEREVTLGVQTQRREAHAIVARGT